VHILREAWRRDASPQALADWANERPTIVVHGSGQSRRLPAYAPIGKPMIPMPVLWGSYGQELDQVLLDLQAEPLDAVLGASPHPSPLLIASGDVLVEPGAALPPLPAGDIVVLGIRAAPEVARHFGVFVRERGSRRLVQSLQKPSPEALDGLGAHLDFLLDVGVWVLGPRAVAALLQACLPYPDDAESSVMPLDLYRDVGGALGDVPSLPREAFAGLSCSVVEMADGAFYHFGTSRQLIEATCALQNDSVATGRVRGPRAHPDQILQNARMDAPTRRTVNHTLWIENCHINDSWSLRDSHVLTGIPEDAPGLRLDPGRCLDYVWLEDGGVCLRPYGLDDAFSGAIGDAATVWMGRPASEWFARRGLKLTDAGLDVGDDIHDAPLFPVMADPAQARTLVQWMVDATPEVSTGMAGRWLETRRLSAAQILEEACVAASESRRCLLRRHALARIEANRAFSVFYRLDLARAAALVRDAEPTDPAVAASSSLERMYDWAWIAARRRDRGESPDRADAEAFAALRSAILEHAAIGGACPTRTLQADQIVWARSPVRLDLAGGWTDTPPYCILHGGRVTNVAVDLNGQPPVQCFVRVVDRPDITVHSIDRGEHERIATYADLDAFAHPGTSFAIARAALALAGFLPRFAGVACPDTLERLLRRFGGGLELSVLAAVPQGSGLGTSSILAATLLAALSNVCGLGWDLDTVMSRTLALEQLMTTGGGWQDQAGGALHGAKLVRSEPGPTQRLSARWLPSCALTAGSALLYYTGLTRLAKGILQDIVHGLFVNDGARLRIIGDIGRNAVSAAEALQKNDDNALGEVVQRSWQLNQALDPGTNPPAVQAILDQVAGRLLGAKLLGAGGGGYLLMIAKDPEAAGQVRRILTGRPPNDRARFMDFSVSPTGLEVTRS
jgi:galactokinase/mevalonate kinase-like predicted kinase